MEGTSRASSSESSVDSHGANGATTRDTRAEPATRRTPLGPDHTRSIPNPLSRGSRTHLLPADGENWLPVVSRREKVGGSSPPITEEADRALLVSPHRKRADTRCPHTTTTSTSSISAVPTDTAPLPASDSSRVPKSTPSSDDFFAGSPRMDDGDVIRLCSKYGHSDAHSGATPPSSSDSNSQKTSHPPLPTGDDTAVVAAPPTGNGADLSQAFSRATRGSRGNGGGGGEGNYTPFDFSVSMPHSYDASHGFDAGTRTGSYHRDVDDMSDDKLTATEASPYESENVKKMRAHSWLLTLFIVVFAVVIALAGGLAIGFANSHFNQESSKRALETKNRIVLNSSVVSLHHAQVALNQEGNHLFSFMEYHTQGKNYTNAKEMRNALFMDFMLAWRMWLSTSAKVDTYSIYVPFCAEDEIGTSSCSTMALVAACSREYQSYCYFARNSDDGLKLEIYDVPSNNDFENSRLIGMISMDIIFFRDQTGNKSYFLPPSQGPEISKVRMYAITLRRQDYLSNGQLIMCDTGGYLQSWFETFASTLQRADDSYSLVFTSDGDVLASQVGFNEQSHCYDLSTSDKGHCQDDRMLRGIARDFLATLQPSLLHEDVETNGEYAVTRTVNNYLVAYQDFLRFRTNSTAPNIVYFVAYATPIDMTIGTDGVIQIVVCVVVIVICVLILGLVAATAVNQMQKVIQLVSRLATHASTYDTEKMEKVLEQNSKTARHRCWRVILSSTIIEDEFQRILDNLKAYRPFLPPSLLTPGHAFYDDSSTIFNPGDEHRREEERGDRDGANGHQHLPQRERDRAANARFLDSKDDVHVLSLSDASLPDSSSTGDDADHHHHHHGARGGGGGNGAHRRSVSRVSDGDSAHSTELISTRREQLASPMTGGRTKRVSVAQGGNNHSFAAAAEGVSVSFQTRYTGSEHMEASAVNDRLRKGGLRLVKGTIMVVNLANLSVEAKDADDVINYFLGCVLAHVKAANGVVDVMDTNMVTVSFNCHYPVVRHQEKAVRCALNIRDDLRLGNFGFPVAITIAGGPLYVGTIGTETQRARVVCGDSVTVARQMLSLAVLVGERILVTDAVAHASGSIACVPVDVISIYRPDTNTWGDYLVSAVVGPNASSWTPGYLVARKLFKLIRGRHLDGAIAAAEAVKKAAEAKKEPLHWCVQRLLGLICNSPHTIKEGYKRRAILWELPEGEDFMAKHLGWECHLTAVGAAAAHTSDNPAMASSPAEHSNRTDPPFIGATVTSILAAASFPSGSAGVLSGPRSTAEHAYSPTVAPPTIPVVEETTRARQMIDAAQRTTASRFHGGSAALVNLNEEDALFPVFLPPLDDDEDEDQHNCCTAAADVTPAVHPPQPMQCQQQQQRVEDTIADSDTIAPLPSMARRPRPLGLDAEAPHSVPLRTSFTSPSSSSPAVRACVVAPVVTIDYGSTPSIPSPSPTGMEASLAHKSSIHGSGPGGSGDAARSKGTTGTEKGSHNDNGSVEGCGGCGCGGGGGLSSAGVLSSSGRASNFPQHITSVNGQSFYRTNDLLGRGAFGDVFLAISESGGFVAMKAFPVDDYNAPQLIREVETLSKLRHDHVVAYDCCAVQDGQFFIMSEYMAAGSVRSLIRRLGPIPLPAVRKYSRDILFGLSYLHKNNWLHCDIKPDNVLLTSEGTCKLADFGAAALERSVGTGGVRGTPRYMAPEAFVGEWSAAADVYSFGLTLATMLTGRQPWHANTEPDYLFVVQLAGAVRHARESGTACDMLPDLALPGIDDPDMILMVQRSCAFHPADRPTVDDLINLLL